VAKAAALRETYVEANEGGPARKGRKCAEKRARTITMKRRRSTCPVPKVVRLVASGEGVDGLKCLHICRFLDARST